MFDSYMTTPAGPLPTISPLAVARIAEALPDGLSVLGTSGVHLSVNDAFCQMLGLSREQLLGALPRDLYWPEEEVSRIEAAFANTLGGQFGHHQLTFKRASGERFPVIVSPGMVTDEHGAPAFFFATVKDMSELSVAHSALKDSEERYRALAEMSPFGIAVHVGGTLRYANLAAQRLLGAEEKDLIGRQALDFVHPDDQELVRSRIDALGGSITEAAWARERFVRVDGTVFHAEVAGTATRFDNEPAVQTVFRDISQELEAEQRQAQSNRLEAIGRLAGGVAHDFNNLLTIIMAACEFALGQDSLPDSVAADLRAALQATHHGAALTRQLLAFSRQEPMEVHSLNLEEELGRISPLLERMVGEDVSLVVRVEPETGNIRASQTQLERVILNLVANARDAMPRGGTIQVRACPAPPGTVDEGLGLPPLQPFVRFEVEDDGQGMDAATLKQAFEPFFTTRRGEGGTGLGLASVYGLVHQSGGGVSVKSVVGVGTTVTLHWPQASVGAAASAEHEPPVVVHAAKTVLVIEDQAPVRRVVVAVLRRCGYEVLEAEGYSDGMAILLSDTHIDILLSDVLLRGSTGPEIAQEARLQRPELPLLFMSGHADHDALALARRLTEQTLLAKPFTPKQLEAAVSRAWRGA
jgi:two-component system cell cycle sensor histidine kinase/response regulator CckA